jgi:hypothetical protein
MEKIQTREWDSGKSTTGSWKTEDPIRGTKVEAGAEGSSRGRGGASRNRE